MVDTRSVLLSLSNTYTGTATISSRPESLFPSTELPGSRNGSSNVTPLTRRQSRQGGTEVMAPGVEALGSPPPCFFTAILVAEDF